MLGFSPRFGARSRSVGSRLMIERLDRFGLWRLDLGAVILRHALLEGLDALCDIAHQFGNLAASEQQQHDADHHDPMPQAQTTHKITLRNDGPRERGLASQFGLNLGLAGGKNKDSISP